jgi:ribosomal protein S27AE
MLFQENVDQKKNCPQCGDTLAVHFKYSKLIKCQSCGSSIFLEDEAVKVIGERAVLSDEPSLIQIYTSFSYENNHYLPLGKIRYSYGRGFWEEWFLKNEQNQEFWLSIDEGDFVLEEHISMNIHLTTFQQFKVGK